MSATLFLKDPLGDDRTQIDCEEVKIIGEIVWATPESGDQETVVPLSNVAGVDGDSVDQEIKAIESPGGQFTELITDIA